MIARYICRKLNPKFSTCERQKIEKTHAKEKKQSHTQDSIYVVRQFAYIHRVVGILLLSRKKIQSTAIQSFNLSRTITTNPNHKTAFSKSYAQDSQWATKWAKKISMSAPAWAYQPKPPLHGLNLRKSPIKNHATLFGSPTGSNKIRLYKTQQYMVGCLVVKRGSGVLPIKLLNGMNYFRWTRMFCYHHSIFLAFLFL